MWAKQSVKRSLALILIIGIGLFLAYAAWPYRNAFFGAIILYFLFRPLYHWLHSKLKWRAGVSAGLVLVLSIIIILLPVSLLATLLIDQVQSVIGYARDNIGSWSHWGDKIPLLWRDKITQELSNILNNVGGFFVVTVKAVGSQVITYCIMYFMFFYLLVADERKLKNMVISVMPFSKSNTIKLQQEFNNITHSTIVATGLIAVGQGVMLTLGLFLFGVPGALVFGFLGMIMAFLPLIGVPAIWLPASIWLMASGRLWSGVGLLVWGLVISNVDNFVRPMLQRRLGKIHPVVSILGVFIGLSFFGILGVVIGPLILTYFLLTIKMFNQEYIETTAKEI